MKMPIVRRHPMAMNESVAATCCYRMVPSPAAITFEVLNGGSIKSGPEKILQWNPSISPDWRQLDFDVDFTGYTGPKTVPIFNSLRREWWVLFFAEDRFTSAISMEGFLNAQNGQVAAKNYGCKHDTKACLYMAEVAAPTTNNHVDATKDHFTAGGDWRQPHTAQQFNS